MTFIRNQIVRDELNNHFRVTKQLKGIVFCESVATKELFEIPAAELVLTTLRPR